MKPSAVVSRAQDMEKDDEWSLENAMFLKKNQELLRFNQM
jgi:hypothetical protein